MNKSEFNKLSIEKQVHTFNELLNNSSIRKACENIGIGKSTVRDRFKRHNYLYNSNTQKYELVNSEKVLIEQKSIINKNVNVVKTNESERLETMYLELNEILGMKDDLKELIENYKAPKEKDGILTINNFEGNLKVKSIKIYESVLIEFNNFMTKHKELKQQEVLSQALSEFIEKYK